MVIIVLLYFCPSIYLEFLFYFCLSSIIYHLSFNYLPIIFLPTYLSSIYLSILSSISLSTYHLSIHSIISLSFSLSLSSIHLLSIYLSSCCCFTSSPAFGVVSVPDFGHSNRHVVISYFCFHLHFPNDICYEATFYMLICHLYIFFGKLSLKVFGPFLNWVSIFLLMSFNISVHILDKSFIRSAICKYFLS